MPNFVKIRQFEQKIDSKNFAGGGKKKKSKNKIQENFLISTSI